MALFGRKTQQPPAELAAKQDDTGKADPTGAMLLTKPAGAKMIGEEDIKRATEILQKYKAGKGNLEQRLKDEEDGTKSSTIFCWRRRPTPTSRARLPAGCSTHWRTSTPTQWTTRGACFL